MARDVGVPRKSVLAAFPFAPPGAPTVQSEGLRRAAHRWQAGHQKVLRWPMTRLRMGVAQVRQGWPARP